VRVRPLNDVEREKGKAWKVEGNGVFHIDPASEARVSDNSYKLDAIFDGNQPTNAVYELTTQGLIRQVVNGFNSTVFAYGQTSSGKTHTMKGTAEEPGIIPLAVQEVFQLISACQDREFLLRVSYMEVRDGRLGCCWGLVGAADWRCLMWALGYFSCTAAGTSCPPASVMLVLFIVGNVPRPAAPCVLMHCLPTAHARLAAAVQ
jgi:hypothetical protein